MQFEIVVHDPMPVGEHADPANRSIRLNHNSTTGTLSGGASATTASSTGASGNNGGPAAAAGGGGGSPGGTTSSAGGTTGSGGGAAADPDEEVPAARGPASIARPRAAFVFSARPPPEMLWLCARHEFLGTAPWPRSSFRRNPRRVNRRRPGRRGRVHRADRPRCRNRIRRRPSRKRQRRSARARRSRFRLGRRSFCWPTSGPGTSSSSSGSRQLGSMTGVVGTVVLVAVAAVAHHHRARASEAVTRTADRLRMSQTPSRGPLSTWTAPACPRPRRRRRTSRRPA